MFALLFLHVGNIATSAALSGVNLDCTNNYDRLMSCHFDAPNCTDYNVTLRSLDGYGEKYCLPVQCTSGKCCCSINMYLILYETHTASVRRGDKYVESKNISIKFSLKPNAPTIVSVKESNGNLRVAWRPNIEKAHIREQMRTIVTYRKKGYTKEVSEKSVVTADGLSYLEILSEHLEPSTTYVFTAQNILTWGSPHSDLSKEFEFTTSPARERLLVAVIVSLSLVAVIATSGAYGCYVKCRAKYWDSVIDHQKSKLLDLNPSEHEVLKPTPPIISSIYVEPPTPDDTKSWSKGSLLNSSIESLHQSSGIGNSPSSLSYTHTETADIILSVQEALRKALVTINPMSPSTDRPLTSSLPSTRLGPCCGEQFSGTCRCENKTKYSFIRPSDPTQIKTEQSQSGILCHSDYKETGSASACPDRQASACEDTVLPTVVSSYMLTDTSHQQGSRDSGRFSNYDASLSCSKTSLNGDVESRTGEGQENCKEMFVGSDDGSLPVSCNYQTFQSLRRHSDIAFADWKSHEKDDNLKNFGEKPIDDARKVEAQGFMLPRPQDSLPVDDAYRPFPSPVKLPGINVADQNCVEKTEDLNKILDKRLENTSKGDEVHRFMLPRPQDSLPVDGAYRPFLSPVNLPGIKVADQNCVEKTDHLNKILDKRLENASKGDEGLGSFMLASSLDSLPVDPRYQAFQSTKPVLPTVVTSYILTDTSHQQGPRDSGETPGSYKEIFVGADDGSLLVSCNYHTFQSLRRHSDITFADPKSSKKVENWEKSSEKQLEYANKGDKGHSLPVNIHYQAIPGYKIV
uniref:uncharacterized protein LOC131139518 n=1 Tax=Doryrhamphus excisus TaxID=161450 RepID=UPI0025ADD027|nr:uncharacterized protein LOC131139518 [Doryrhamphus excisus]